jgi:2'-hydroxyisoflavone reductase
MIRSSSTHLDASQFARLRNWFIPNGDIMAHILMIGGTSFSGYFAAHEALRRGHRLTVFTRGKSNPDAIPDIEHVQGDRTTDDIILLRGRPWDAVIDTCGYVPRVTRRSAELLRDQVGLYVYVSSVSVYAEMTEGADESAPLNTLADPTVEQVTGETYGGLKVLCETSIREVMGDQRALIIRPGLIVGPRDPTYRFDYWVNRVARGGEVLAPSGPQYPAQFIDGRDLGEWFIRAVEANLHGTMNAIRAPLDFGTLLDTCRSVIGSNAQFTWVSDTFLAEQQVTPWAELPLYAGDSDRALLTASNSRAVKAGLTFRPLEDTIHATLNDLRGKPGKAEGQPTLSMEREAELLRAWHAWQTT